MEAEERPSKMRKLSHEPEEIQQDVAMKDAPTTMNAPIQHSSISESSMASSEHNDDDQSV